MAVGGSRRLDWQCVRRDLWSFLRNPRFRDLFGVHVYRLRAPAICRRLFHSAEKLVFRQNERGTRAYRAGFGPLGRREGRASRVPKGVFPPHMSPEKRSEWIRGVRAANSARLLSCGGGLVVLQYILLKFVLFLDIWGGFPWKNVNIICGRFRSRASGI